MATPFKSIWPTASSTMDVDHVGEREFVVSVGEMAGGGAQLYWTDDGTNAGATMTSVTTCPFIWVLATDAQDRNMVNDVTNAGPKMSRAGSTDPGKPDQYFHRTELVSSLWRTLVFNVGEGASGASAGLGSSRKFYAYCFPEA